MDVQRFELRLPFSDIFGLKPLAGHVTPQNEPAPRIEASVKPQDLFVVGDATLIARARKCCPRPGVQGEPIIAPDELQKIFCGIVADAFDPLHLLHQIRQ